MQRILENVRNQVKMEIRSLDKSTRRVATDFCLQYIYVNINKNDKSTLGDKFKYSVTIENRDCEMLDYNYFKANEIDDLVAWVENHFIENLPKERMVTKEEIEKYALEKYEEGGHVVVECWTQENYDDYLRWYRTKSDLDILFDDYKDYFNRF